MAAATGGVSTTGWANGTLVCGGVTLSPGVAVGLSTLSLTGLYFSCSAIQLRYRWPLFKPWSRHSISTWYKSSFCCSARWVASHGGTAPHSSSYRSSSTSFVGIDFRKKFVKSTMLAPDSAYLLPLRTISRSPKLAGLFSSGTSGCE